MASPSTVEQSRHRRLLDHIALLTRSLRTAHARIEELENQIHAHCTVCDLPLRDHDCWAIQEQLLEVAQRG